MAMLPALLPMFLLAAPSASAEHPSQPSSNVRAVDAKGHVLRANPVLQPNDQVAVSFTGFKPGSTASVRTLVRATGRFTSAPVRVYADGTVRTTVAVTPKTLRGDYVLTVVGEPRTVSDTSPRTSPEQQTITVTVPQIGVFPYRIGQHAPRVGGAGAGASGGGHPARVGFAVVRWAAVALLAAVGGHVIAAWPRRGPIRAGR